MQGFNHIAGGLAFTGLFASFHDVNVFERPEYIALTIGAALLPDIDHTRSLIGKSVYPLAKWISVKFGHRTVTHSLPFYLATLAIVNSFEWFFLRSNAYTYTILVAYALLSHLVFDMCTRSGIPFFYPFSTRPCVLPANPSMRLRSNDLRSEAVIFVLFNGLLLFCWPLFGAGFWQKYNQTFLNYDHIQREAKRKGDMLEISFLNANKDTLKGLLIDYKENTFVSYHHDHFETHDQKDIQFLGFKHTQKAFKTKSYQVFNVSPDSLKKHFKQPLLSLQIQCNQELFYYEGAVLKSGKTIQKEYIKDFDFYIEKQDNSTTEQEIESLQARISSLLSSYQNEMQQLRQELTIAENTLRENNHHYHQMSDYEKGRWIRQRPDIEKEIQQIRQEISRKTPPNTHEDETHLRHLRQQLKEETVLVSANLVGWE